ncbi:class A beta-lactamase-related serine hydrolase [Nonomuraea mesophila]|uniref:Class A beta-lactamase-related serine hydrolase n=1 Tax=Nonomuraea mesophila TaxID=2530382 RepID=A0A4R5FUL3_9ACTN|nr:serine hydrolase domain-containing protein [Nonomuraea mesophila]TDE57624.1 class A beta-lactamase-related serine hydrolase [Nonomuraea mesophila]
MAGLTCAVLTLSVASPPAAASTGADLPRFGDVQRALTELAESDLMVGAIGALYVDGRLVGKGSAGTRLLNGGGTIPADARYRIGSQTKQMVAAVVVQLVGEDRISLEDKLSDVLPDTADQDLVEPADQITIRQLLDHTSGIPDYFGALGENSLFDFTTHYPPAELVKRSRSPDRQQEPGETFSYSNTNYILLGMIIERPTGKPPADELDRRVFRPLHMNRTYLPTKPPEGIRGPHGHGYAPDSQGELRDVDRINASTLWAAGGVVSTARDISVFERAFIQGGLVPPELQDVLRGLVLGGGGGGGERPCAGKGLEITTVTGSAPGFRATTFTTSDGRVQFAVSTTLTKQDNAALSALSRAAAESVLCPGK